jgi:23S rRNA (adenine2503-C2)-methyltransferase
MPVLLKNHTSAELHELLAHAGVTPHLARRLLAAAVRRGELPALGKDLGAKLRGTLETLTAIPHVALVNKTVSATDDFAKYVFRGHGPGLFEAVRIPLLHRPHDLKYVVCVSSQVGCAMGCAFCATGRMGFGRNLAAWEIVDQVVKLQADSPHPVRGVVFMGMGEPMLNYDAVMRAVRILSDRAVWPSRPRRSRSRPWASSMASVDSRPKVIRPGWWSRSLRPIHGNAGN